MTRVFSQPLEGVQIAFARPSELPQPPLDANLWYFPAQWAGFLVVSVAPKPWQLSTHLAFNFGSLALPSQNPGWTSKASRRRASSRGWAWVLHKVLSGSPLCCVVGLGHSGNLDVAMFMAKLRSGSPSYAPAFHDCVPKVNDTLSASPRINIHSQLFY